MADVAGEVIIPKFFSGVGEVQQSGDFASQQSNTSALIELVSFTPTSGTQITDETELSFIIRSQSDFLRIMVTAEYPGLNFVESIYAQNPVGGSAQEFEELFHGTVETIVDPGWFRYKFTFRRLPKWIDSPTIGVYAFNNTGVEL